MAANHWRLAIDTHQANHPDTAHDCADISQVEPSRYPSTDILWASPECTNHSVAKGISRQKRAEARQRDLLGLLEDPLPDDAAVRSRATMWDVLRFAEFHRYKAIITENVVDAAKWELMPAWRMGLANLGYDYRFVFLNSAHAQRFGAPAPQSRDRMYVVAWRKGERAPDFEAITRPRCWCAEHGWVDGRQSWKRQDREPWGRYGAQYVYTCTRPNCGRVVEPWTMGAYTAIDWSIPAERIGDRAKPLAEKTMRRIREGLRRYGMAEPLIQRINNQGEASMAHLSTPVSEPMRTLTASGAQAILDPTGALVLEAAGNTYDSADPKHPAYGHEGGYMRIWPATEPLRTLHTSASKAVLVPDGVLIGAVHGSPVITTTDEPMRTLTTAYTRGLLIPTEGRDGKRARSDVEPMRTQTTRNETGLLMPYYGAAKSAKPTSEPMGTLTTTDRYALVPTPPSDREVDVDDCGFRMLEPKEVTWGMAFPRDYQMLGTKREQVKLAGNAVTPPAGRDLIGTVVEAITGETVAA
ncbi:MAG: DNA cytosine methyltransferase, partial [Propionibacterium sp.]|nr:DNA cytosine methyltransferase [Propionibacterium sp.]